MISMSIQNRHIVSSFDRAGVNTFIRAYSTLVVLSSLTSKTKLVVSHFPMLIPMNSTHAADSVANVNVETSAGCMTLIEDCTLTPTYDAEATLVTFTSANTSITCIDVTIMLLASLTSSNSFLMFNCKLVTSLKLI